jgi:hypothetical protein
MSPNTPTPATFGHGAIDSDIPARMVVAMFNSTPARRTES